MNSLENIPYSTVSKEKKLSALETDNKQGVGRWHDYMSFHQVAFNTVWFRMAVIFGLGLIYQNKVIDYELRPFCILC